MVRKGFSSTIWISAVFWVPCIWLNCVAEYGLLTYGEQVNFSENVHDEVVNDYPSTYHSDGLDMRSDVHFDGGDDYWNKLANVDQDVMQDKETTGRSQGYVSKMHKLVSSISWSTVLHIMIASFLTMFISNFFMTILKLLLAAFVAKFIYDLYKEKQP